MGMLIDGQWSDADVRRTNENGEFVRPVSPFRHWIGSDDGAFPARAGRYHLFVAFNRFFARTHLGVLRSHTLGIFTPGLRSKHTPSNLKKG